jgi:penicillin-binding protein 1A
VRPSFQLLERRTSFVLLCVRALCVLVGWSGVVAAVAALWVWGDALSAQRVPDVLAVGRGTAPSEVRSARGFVIGGLQRGPRAWTPWEELGDNTVRALLAAEDDRFFRHEGFSVRGIVRAAVENRRAGRAVQGDSTITQQLAKTLVGRDRTFARKFAELAVARRLERQFSKREIFEAWVNQIYFGDGAEGITAAAHRYFDVAPAELTLAQAALLASLIPAPSAYHPRRNAERARVRRDRVLRRLERTGLATTREVNRALASDLQLTNAGEDRVDAPSVERAVWRALAAELQDAAIPVDPRRDGRIIHTSVDLVRQRRAERAVRNELHDLDERQGWRGPLGRVPVEAREAVVERLRAAADAGRFSGHLRPALVREAQGQTLVVHASEEWSLARAAWSWAVPFREDAANHAETIDRIDGVVDVGDLVLLRDGARLAQWPRVEAAWVSADLLDGAIESIVAGYDPVRSEFDRVTQGCRQPGSTFKPYVYAAAFLAGFTPATVVRDAPFRYLLGPFEEWRPRNADGRFQGHRPIWDAFVWSRNLPALQIGREVGSRRILHMAQTLGVESPIASVASLSLGASCVRPVELLRGYHTFGRQGFATDLSWISSVAPANGNRRVHLPRRLDAGTAHRVADMWTGRRRVEEPVLRRDVAFQIGWLMRDVVAVGTGSELRSLGFPVAGKTGTTNLYDAWFAGFTAREAAVIWVGTDVNTRPLGRRESGGRRALPAWGAALMPVPTDWPLLGELPAGMVIEAIDPETGELGAIDRYSVRLPFRAGTEPRRRALSNEERMTRDADRHLRLF